MDLRFNNKLAGDTSPNTVLQNRRQENFQTYQFGHHEAAVLAPEESISLLSVSINPSGSTSINRESLSKLSSLTSLTDNKHKIKSTDKEYQSPSMTISELDKELASVISKLNSHQRASEENRQQIRLLKIDLEKLIKFSIENDEMDDEDTADLLYFVLSSVKAGLTVVASRMNNADLSEENKNYLYSLSRLQLEFYFADLPFPMFNLMTLFLEGHCLPKLIHNAAERTKTTIDKMLSVLPLGEEISDETMGRYVVNTFGTYKNSITPDDNGGILRLGAFINLHKIACSSRQPSATMIDFFNFSGEEYDETILPQLNTFHMSIIASVNQEILSVLANMNSRTSKQIENSYFNYLHIERWSAAVQEQLISQNNLGEHCLVEIKDQLKQFNEIVNKMPATFIADPSVFLRRLLNADTISLIQSFEEWLLDGLFNFITEVIDPTKSESSEVKTIKENVTLWLLQNQNQSRIQELVQAIETIEELMVTLRKGIDETPDPEQRLFDQMLNTVFRRMAYEHLLAQPIETSNPDSSPIDQLTLKFAIFKEQLEKRRPDLFNMNFMKRGFVENNRVINSAQL